MKMRQTLMTALVLALTTGLLSTQAVIMPRYARQPLNVVLLVIDDVRWDSLGAAGNRTVPTPRIDQLATDGVRFDQARVTTSICMVSRATLLTGQYMLRRTPLRTFEPGQISGRSAARFLDSAGSSARL